MLALGGPPWGVPGADPSSAPGWPARATPEIFPLVNTPPLPPPPPRGGGPGGPPKSALGALPAGGPKQGRLFGRCGCCFPSFAGVRTMSLLLFVVLCCFTIYTISPRRLSGERPQLGDGVPKLALGGPPGGVPGAVPSSGPGIGSTQNHVGPGGGPGGAPGGPGGGVGGAPGASGGVRGPLPGGYPPGGPRGGPPPTRQTPRLEPPPRGPPRAGHFGGVRTRWGQNQAKSSLTVVYRGGRGAPPKAHWVRSLQGGPNRAQSQALVGVLTPLRRSIAPCLSVVAFVHLLLKLHINIPSWRRGVAPPIGGRVPEAGPGGPPRGGPRGRPVIGP
jgi:hypothetical protein